MVDRLMPDRTELGQFFNGPMLSAMRFRDDAHFGNPMGLRTVMGFILPPWQRGFVWADHQCQSFMESVWRGLPIGTYTVNIKVGGKFDGWLIDGQQRMRALERYLNDEFPVCGYRFSEITSVDVRAFTLSRIWGFYESWSNDETYLRNYYNLMNFGGTAHEPHERA